jgi:hypothetical protein
VPARVPPVGGGGVRRARAGRGREQRAPVLHIIVSSPFALRPCRLHRALGSDDSGSQASDEDEHDRGRASATIPIETATPIARGSYLNYKRIINKCTVWVLRNILFS